MAAITLADKCLGLTSEVLADFKWIQINLIRSGSSHCQTDPERPAAKPPPAPPLQFTK
jgi:hypothetical protein